MHKYVETLTAPYTRISDKPGTDPRYLYRTEAAATRAVVGAVLCQEQNTHRAATVRAFLAGGLSTDSPDHDSVSEAVDRAYTALLAARGGNADDTFDRDVLTSASTAARAAVRVYRKHGDEGLSAHDRNERTLRSAAMEYERIARAAKASDPFA